jgi:hypothetical protein
MLTSKQFYTFPTRLGSGGMRFVNINNIASIEDLAPGIRVILNVTNKKGEYEMFDVDLPFGHVTGEIVYMDDHQPKQEKQV